MTNAHITMQVQSAHRVALCRNLPVQAEVAPTSFMLHAAALSALVGDDLDLEISHSHAGGGVQWIKVAWSGREVIMKRLADDWEWTAFDPALYDAIGTGATPEDALRAILAHP